MEVIDEKNIVWGDMIDPNLNQKQREERIIDWADFVRTHPDEEWSKFQDIFINSWLRSVKQLTRKGYLQLKGEL